MTDAVMAAFLARLRPDLAERSWIMRDLVIDFGNRHGLAFYTGNLRVAGYVDAPASEAALIALAEQLADRVAAKWGDA